MASEPSNGTPSGAQYLDALTDQLGRYGVGSPQVQTLVQSRPEDVDENTVELILNLRRVHESSKSGAVTTTVLPTSRVPLQSFFSSVAAVIAVIAALGALFLVSQRELTDDLESKTGPFVRALELQARQLENASLVGGKHLAELSRDIERAAKATESLTAKLGDSEKSADIHGLSDKIDTLNHNVTRLAEQVQRLASERQTRPE